MATAIHTTTTPVPLKHDQRRNGDGRHDGDRWPNDKRGGSLPSGYSAREDMLELRRTRAQAETGSRLLLQRLIEHHGS